MSRVSSKWQIPAIHEKMDHQAGVDMCIEERSQKKHLSPMMRLLLTSLSTHP